MKVRSSPRRCAAFASRVSARACAASRDARTSALSSPIRRSRRAGVFTTNRVKAAPVFVAQERIRRGQLQAVVANSGSANCFTGKTGLKLAHDSAASGRAGQSAVAPNWLRRARPA